MEPEKEIIIAMKQVSKTYEMGGETINALDQIDFTVTKGEFVSIVGPSGSGKSTLMNILGLLDLPDNGSYQLNHFDIQKMKDSQMAKMRNQTIGFVFQSFYLLPKLNAWENVQVPLIYRGCRLAEAKKMAYDVLDKVGLKGREKHLPSQLSGGQQQRVAIARALVGNPPILLADEPTGALDSKTGNEIMGILHELNQKGKTIILITHDLSIAKQAQKTVQIADGKLSDELAI